MGILHTRVSLLQPLWTHIVPITMYTKRLFIFSALLCLTTIDNTFAEETLILNAVNVTAEHREQALSEVAASIDVFTAETATEQRLQQLNDLNNLTSNLSIQRGGRFKTINIRGVGGGGTNAGFDTRVGVYVDGVYMGQGMALGNPIFDIERVDILKGPQGYLFGNNSDAGVINITTKQPSRTREISLTTGVGNYGLFENTLLLNGAINDKLTARITLNNADRNGYVHNAYNNDDLKYMWRFASRAQFTLAATDQLDLNLTADYSNNHQEWYLHQATTGLFDQPLPADEVSFDRVNVNREPVSRIKGHGFSLNANYYFDNDAQFTATLAKRDWQTHLTTDNDHTAADLTYSDNKDQIRQYSQEFRYTSAEDIDWPFVLGVYLQQDQTDNDRFALFGGDTNTTLVNVANVPFPIPFSAAFNIAPNSSAPVNAQVKTDIKALYTNIDHPFGQHYVLHLGGRYSIETKKLNYSIDGSQSGRLDIAVVNQAKDKIRQTFFSPMLGLSYFFNKQTQVYAKASRAYKSGGWNADFLTAAQFNDGYEYDAESVNAVEIGYKSHKPRRQLSIAAFANFYKDYQISQFANLGGDTLIIQLRNAASVKSQGLEFNYRQLFGKRWTLDSKLAYLDARFERFPGGRLDGAADGERLPDAPEFSGSITVHYQAKLPVLSKPVKLSLQDNFQTKTYSGLSNEPSTAALGSRNIVNAYANYTTANKHWSFQIWGKNLTNKHYALTRGRDFYRNQITTYALPRMYGVNGTYRF